MSADQSHTHVGVPVTALLLYRSAERTVATTFLKALNEAVRNEGEHFAFAPTGDDGCHVFQGSRHHVVIEEVEARLPAADFSTALAHPFIETVFPAARPIVEGHAAHVRIVVAGGHAGNAAAHPDVDSLDLDDFGPDAVLPRLRILRAAANAYAGQRFPLAVHWCQSDHLLAGPDYVQLAEKGAETELFVKAIPYSGSGGATYGAISNGATSVIGREVELAEAAVPPAWAVDRLLQFVEKARAEVPLAGQALRFPSDEIVLVHDEPESRMFPLGHLRLTVEKLPDGLVAPHVHDRQEEASIGFLGEMDARTVQRAFGRR